MTSQRVIILTWNPSNDDLSDEEDAITTIDWSCQSYRSTKKGDRFIFVRTGNKDPGLISFGEVLEDPTLGEDCAGKTRHFVNIKFFVPLCPNSKPIITRDELYKKYHKDIKERTFSPQSSGAELKPEIASDLWSLLEDLCKKADIEPNNSAKKKKTPKRKEVLESRILRSTYVKQCALKSAKGICQLCGQQGPFIHNGSYFLEVHHIVPLSEGGEDDKGNAIALCPNCHRKMHLINKIKDKNLLLKRAKKLSEDC